MLGCHKGLQVNHFWDFTRLSGLGFENPSEGVDGPLDPENSYLTLQGLNAMFKAVYYLELVSIAWALITNVFRTAKCNLASQHYKYSYTGINSGSSNVLYFYSAVATWFMMYETLNNDVMPNVKDVCIVV